MADALLTVKEAAKVAGLTYKSIMDAAARGALLLSAWPAYQQRRPGGVRLFGVRRDDLDDFLAERRNTRRVCPVCETRFTVGRAGFGAISAQKYCSYRCSHRAQTRQVVGLPISDRERAEVIYEITCEWCDTLIYTPNRNQMFCSHSCRQMDYAARKQERRA